MRVNSRCISRTVNASGHRHERFRVAPHAVLADVEPFHLFTSGDTQADSLLDNPEQAIAEHKHCDERGSDGYRLGPQLVEAAGVEKTTRADAIELGQRGRREEATAQGAPDPGHTVRGQGANRVV